MAGVFFVFLTLLFTLLHAMPGDITNNLIGNPNIPASAREQLRQELAAGPAAETEDTEEEEEFEDGDSN
mgnify:CR=1 FL=1